MERCHQLYKRLQEDIKNLGVIIPDKDLLNEETMAMFCLTIMMKKKAIQERDYETLFSHEPFEAILDAFETFDETTKKTIWLYFDLFVKMCEKYTKEQTSKLVLDSENVDITYKMTDVSYVLENQFGMNMSTGMEDMVGIIAQEVQQEIKKGNTNMQGIITNVMEKVMDQFKEKIESGEIDVDALKQSAEKLMSQMGNPAAMLGMNNGPQLSREEKRRQRRERLRKKLEAKQL